MARYCPKCRADTERKADGRCKPCVKAYKAAYFKANPEKLKELSARYYKANFEKINAKGSEYYKANIEKVKSRIVAWREVNLDKMKASCAAYNKEMPDPYITRLIRKGNSQLKQVQIPTEMIEAKRAEIKLKRLIKEMKNENTQ